MKTKTMKNTLIAAMLLLSTTMAFSQNGYGRMIRGNQGQNQIERPNFEKPQMMNFLDLSEEQQTKIDALRTKHLKEVNEIRAQLKIKNAELDALETNAAPSLKTINVKIDEIAVLKTQLQKSRAAHHQEIRAELSDEQKVKFDAHRSNRGNGNGFGKGGQRNGARHMQRNMNCPNL